VSTVLVDLVSILHAEVEDLGFGITHGIVRAKVGPEPFGELLETVHP